MKKEKKEKRNKENKEREREKECRSVAILVSVTLSFNSAAACELKFRSRKSRVRCVWHDFLRSSVECQGVGPKSTGRMYICITCVSSKLFRTSKIQSTTVRITFNRRIMVLPVKQNFWFLPSPPTPLSYCTMLFWSVLLHISKIILYHL